MSFPLDKDKEFLNILKTCDGYDKIKKLRSIAFSRKEFVPAFTLAAEISSGEHLSSEEFVSKLRGFQELHLGSVIYLIAAYKPEDSSADSHDGELQLMLLLYIHALEGSRSFGQDMCDTLRCLTSSLRRPDLFVKYERCVESIAITGSECVLDHVALSLICTIVRIARTQPLLLIHCVDD